MVKFLSDRTSGVPPVIFSQLVLIFGLCMCTRAISTSAIITSGINTSAIITSRINTSAIITSGINTSAIIASAIYLCSCIMLLGANKERLWISPVIHRFLYW